MRMTIFKQDVAKVNPLGLSHQEENHNKGDVNSLRCGYASSG